MKRGNEKLMVIPLRGCPKRPVDCLPVDCLPVDCLPVDCLPVIRSRKNGECDKITAATLNNKIVEYSYITFVNI